MMKKLNILWLVLGLCGGCNDFLSETPPDEVTPESTKSFSELLLSQGYMAKNAEFDRMTYYMDDDVENIYPEGSPYSPGSEGYDDEDLQQKLFYTWQPLAADQVIEEKGSSLASGTNGYVPWKGYYECILGCNLILDYADGSTGTDEDKDYLKGQAYFLRAFYYFQLVNLYGLPYNDEQSDPEKNLGVPLIEHAVIGELVFPRNTVAEVYKLIVEDIENAMKYLDKEQREAVKYRVTYLPAHLLASRIYLYMNNWEKALEHARYVMERKSLCDYTELAEMNWSTDDDGTKHLFRLGNDDILWLFGYKRNWWGYSDATAMSDAFMASSALYALFDEEGLTDKRKNYFFYEKNGLLSVKKFTKTSSAYAQGFRTTEAYLNAIEALLMQYKEGNTEAGNGAFQLLNEFRRMRYVSADGTTQPDVTMGTADELLEIYKLERRKELCFEGQRWFDLRRYGMPRIEKTWTPDGTTREIYVLEERDPMYVQDIPSMVTDLNPGIEPNESLPGQRQPVSL